MHLIKRVARGLRGNWRSTPESVAGYWTRHNVTAHRRFTSAAESLTSFEWRNSQYANYLELMPVAGFDGRAVLDFGCGPGHDLVGLGTYSRCARLVGADISATSLAEARERLSLHTIDAELMQLMPGTVLPFAASTFDHIHTSGVLHHLEDPLAVLRSLAACLRPGGTMHVMVYNYDSIWTHLKVAYHRTILQGLYATLSLREQFARSTDGEECPISRCYKPDEFIATAAAAGLSATFAGAAVSMIEMALLPSRFDAIMDRRLPAESRRFLESLEFDSRGLPLFGGRHAGVDGVYHLRK